jgi:hypothetical protein
LINYLTVGFGFPYVEHVKFTVELKIASIFVISFFIRGGTAKKNRFHNDHCPIRGTLFVIRPESDTDNDG